MALALCLFNPKKFYQTLVSSQTITDKLNSLRTSCDKNDIQYIFSSINVIYEVLISVNQLPLTKYNALLAVNEILLTASTFALSLIQIYILPLISEIGLHQVYKRSEAELEGYFIDQGFRDSVGIRKVGRKFVLLAIQIIICAATIKPHSNLLHSEMQGYSKFKIIMNSLKEKQLKVQQIKINNDQSLLRNKYLSNLKHFQHSQLGIFLTRKLKEEIVFNQGLSPFFRKMLESDDCFISVSIINTCVSVLSDICQDFPHKRHYLNLFSYYIKQGDIYAIVIVHNAIFVRQIFQQIIKVKGDMSLTYGKMIFPNVQATHQQKYDFYCEYLRCIQIWASCLPENQIGEISQPKQMYNFLREDRNFIFPEILMLQKIVDEYIQNISKKQARNQQILRMIEQDQNMFSHIGSYKSSMDSTFLKLKSRQSRSRSVQKGEKILQHSAEKQDQQNNASFNQLLQQVDKCLVCIQQGKKISDNMAHLTQFKAQWQNLKLAYTGQISLAKLKMGDQYAHKIGSVNQLYCKLQNKQLSFRTFRQKVNQLVNPKKIQLTYVQKIKQKSSPKNSASFQDPNKTIQQIQEEDSVQRSFLKMKLKSHRSSNLKVELHQKKNIQHKQTPKQPSEKLDQKIGRHNLSSKRTIKQQQNISPITHDEYCISDVMAKGRKNLKKSNSNNSDSIINSCGQKMLPSDLVNSEVAYDKLSHSEQLKNTPQEDYMRQNSSRRSAPFQNNSSKQILQTQYLSKQTPQKFTNTEASTQKFKNSSRKEKIINRQVYDVYQIRLDNSNNGDLSSSRYEREEGPRRVRGFGGQRCRYEKIMYSMTARSIEAYREYVSKSTSTKKIQSRYHSFDKSNKSRDKSIIKRQYQKIKSRQVIGQRRYFLSQSSSKNYNCSDIPVLPSSLLSDKLKTSSLNKSQPNQQIITNQYSSFFPTSKEGNIIKNCIKNKGILYESSQIQIGYVHFKKDLNLDFTIFLTPKISVHSLQIFVEGNQNLKTCVDFNNFRKLVAGKQQTIKISTSLTGIPYGLPKLRLKMKQSKNQQKIQINIILPCTFNKYVILKSLSNDCHQSTIRAYQKGINFRTSNFKIIKKLSHSQNLIKNMPFFTLVKSQSKSLSYICECVFQSESFLLELVQQQKCSCYLLGRTVNGQSKSLEFILSSLFYLLKE